MSFGENLKRLRERRRMTQTELAERAGVTQGYIAKLEPPNWPGREKTIQRTNPSLAIAQRLAEALGVSLSELLEETRRKK